ncbi:MAG: hypothetical protein H7Z19_04950 [Chitinophagaceae bacterium]|nr:hypothetical protein [Rubrivivax sp.]
MNRSEITQLCRLVRAFCPAQAFDEFSTEAWQLILSTYDYTDAKAAVAEMASVPLEPGKARYIEPGHIIAGVRRIRGARLAATLIPAPPPEIEGAVEQIAWQRRARDEIAAGRYVAPEPVPAIAAPKGLAVTWGPVIPSPVLMSSGDREIYGPRMTESELNAERARQLAALEALAATNEEAQR